MVIQGSVEFKVCLKLPHMTGTRNETPGLLILSRLSQTFFTEGWDLSRDRKLDRSVERLLDRKSTDGLL